MSKRNRDDNILSPNGASLGSLDDDTLMAVLLRTRATDHANLRVCCKRLRDMIDSVQFRKERSVQGFVEVKVELLSPFEQYQQNSDDKSPSKDDKEFLANYNELGYICEYDDNSFETDCFRVCIDERPMHKLKQDKKAAFKLHVRLLPLRASFWELCDCYNQALYDLGTSLFTDKGKPKVASLKSALADNDDRYAANNMLYIEDLYVPFEYRMTASTVGPLLIKKLLQIFDGLYTIAMYIPYRETQYSEGEDKAEKERDHFRFRDEMTDEDIQAEQELQERNELLTQQDMRQFFRAGFHQVDDRVIVETSDYSYVFATPDDAVKPILSVEEVMNKSIARKTPKRPEARGLARELRILVEKRMLELNEKMDKIMEFRGPPLQIPLFRRLFRDPISRLQEVQYEEDELDRAVQQRTLTDRELSDLEGRRDIVRSSRMDLEQSLDQITSEVHEILTEAAVNKETELETFKSEVREEVKVVMDKTHSPLQIVLDSDVIHVAAIGGNLNLLEMVLESLSVSEKTTAVNGLDRDGLTPLMVVAGVAPVRGLAKYRQIMETLIRMGADVNIADSSRGLSALGYFRESRKRVEFPSYIELPADFPEEASRIEGLLRPANGPTPSDDTVLETKDESDSDMDEFDY